MTKPYFRKKGTYKDGRDRIVLEKQVGRVKITKNLPKPEILWLLLDGLKSSSVN